MKTLFDKLGTGDALMGAAAAPCCFPLLASAGAALGLGVLLPFEGYAVYGVQACVGVAMVGHVLAFWSHRRLGWLLLGVGSGLLVLAALTLPWPPTSFAYLGLVGLAVTAVANHWLVRRASCTSTPISTMLRQATMPCPSCGVEAPEHTRGGRA
jgi:mercuric ion transport protein